VTPARPWHRVRGQEKQDREICSLWKLGDENMAVHYTILSTFLYVGKYFCKKKNSNNNTVSRPFLLPSQFTSFHFGQGKVEKGQLMVMASCFNGMRNV